MPLTSASDTSAPTASVIGRVIAVLRLFGPERLSVGVDEIAAALGLSSASAYRYASELSAAGLLARRAGRYRLGPKIIELEYLIRAYDPVIRAGEAVMHDLSRRIGHDVLLSNVYGETVVNVLHVHGPEPVRLTYSKGLPMPQFRGSQTKVALAYLDRRKQKRIFERALLDPALGPDARRIGEDWPAFALVLKRIRQQGYCLARSELDRNAIGIAAPVVDVDESIVGSLVIVLNAHTSSSAKEATLIDCALASAAEISTRIAALAQVGAERTIAARTDRQASAFVVD